MASDVAFLPSVGTCGGILLAAAERFFKLGQPQLTNNIVTVNITMLAENKTWSITGVYGPQSDADKVAFLQEITDVGTRVLPAWLLLGDFNLILNAHEKNNARSALFLQGDVIMDFYGGFRFESHWVHMLGFLDTVQETWYKPVNTQDAILFLHVKLSRMAKSLRNWRRKSLSRWKLSWAILNLTLANLEKAQEERSLTQEELEFKKYLKNKSMGIAAVQKSRARQHARLSWIRSGDTNTRFF
ncbi:unnamed protein product [Miscanthus lutarioriparius]|uniref:Endonuclease/exonuclease/phosphatase domain-containing protein n=1 Tax=Miscanthus lutarioriparius TaxID=422564 RepID=A0A811N5G6_9POAL|nr:unnamed protein product [Miscanthus lutarioriparius]